MSYSKILRIMIAQLNPVVGNITGNLKLARRVLKHAIYQEADLVVFSELFIAGYPAEDLLLKPAFVKQCIQAIESLATDTLNGGPGIIIGCPLYDKKNLFNAVALLDDGEIKAWRKKINLPNYGEFDEKRIFTAGNIAKPVDFRGVKIGVPICEDIWNTSDIGKILFENGAELLIVANASPYYRGKMNVRHKIAMRQVSQSGLPLIYVNQVGGQDELVFDGGSFVINMDQTTALQMKQFEEQTVTTCWKKTEKNWFCKTAIINKIMDSSESDWCACVLGLRDYVSKNGFKSVLIGLSGGIDSAVCAAISVDALGSDKVSCIMMPYYYTSKQSYTDAKACADNLGVNYKIIPIHEIVKTFSKTLESVSVNIDIDDIDENSRITEENIQARIRGTLLMALSNKFGSMVITTGNKSEISVGYTTLYGDMNGGFNPIKDLYKTQVYHLAKWRNENFPSLVLGNSGKIIPDNILIKSPSAELRPNQNDYDSLPPYPILDTILECLIEREMSVNDLIARGYKSDLVSKINSSLYLSEYKRRQAAPGVKITKKHFGRDRRYPIINLFQN